MAEENKTPEALPEPIEITPQGFIRLLVVVDNVIGDWRPLEEGLARQNADYLAGTDNAIGVKHSIYKYDLSNLAWEDYGGGNMGVNRGWIRRDTGDRPRDYYSIAYVIAPQNWKAPGIGGWSVGTFNGFHVQLIRGYNTAYSYYVTFAMELMHGLAGNGLYERLTGKRVEDLFNAYNYEQ